MTDDNETKVTEHEIQMIPHELYYEYYSESIKLSGSVYECDGEPLRDHQGWSLYIPKEHRPDDILHAEDIRAQVKIFRYKNPRFGPDMQTTATPVILSKKEGP